MVHLTVVTFGLWCIIISTRVNTINREENCGINCFENQTGGKVIVMENPLETKLVILRKENSKKNKYNGNNKNVRAISTNYLS